MPRYAALVAVVVAVLIALPARAEQAGAGYPNHAVKIIVCVPAGGGVDTVTRIVADKLQKMWGQPVVVENRAGAAGSIGAEVVASAEPDGYTLLASQPSPITVNAILYKKLAYDPAKLEPVAIMTSIPNVLLVRPDFPGKSVQELIALAKAKPETLTYASQGNGTTSHLTAALFAKVTGIRLVHVPYKGTAPAINDLIASHVDMMFSELASSIHLAKAGKARILAVATDQRIAALPDTPTLKEAGIADLTSDTWNAITAPPQTPAAIVAKINESVNKALKLPDVVARMQALNLKPEGGTPADLARLIKSDTARWGAVIREAHITIN